jgi:hypothetical protein
MGRFLTVRNNGEKVMVIQYQEILPTESFEGSGEVDGIVSFETARGSKLNRISDDEFEVRLDGEILRRVR